MQKVSASLSPPSRRIIQGPSILWNGKEIDAQLQSTPGSGAGVWPVKYRANTALAARPSCEGTRNRRGPLQVSVRGGGRPWDQRIPAWTSPSGVHPRILERVVSVCLLYVRRSTARRKMRSAAGALLLADPKMTILLFFLSLAPPPINNVSLLLSIELVNALHLLRFRLRRCIRARKIRFPVRLSKRVFAAAAVGEH